MSTPSLAPAQSFQSPPRHLAALVLAAVTAIAVAIVVLALNSGTTQSSALAPSSVTVVRSITPAGADMAQGFSGLTYRHSFAGHR